MRAAQLKKFRSSNGIVEIESDVDHTFKTAHYISGSFQPSYRNFPDSINEPGVRDWYAYGDLDQMVPNSNETYAHVRTGESNSISFDLKPFTLNRSIKSLLVEPQTCMNHQECRPSEQAVLLPYLTDKTVYENLAIEKPKFVIAEDDFKNFRRTGGPDVGFDSAEEEASQYQYSLDEHNVLFLSHTKAAGAVEAQLLIQQNLAIQNAGRISLSDADGTANVRTRIIYNRGNNDNRPNFTIPALQGDGHEVEKRAADGSFGIPFQAGKAIDGDAWLGDKLDGEWAYVLDLQAWKIRIHTSHFEQPGLGGVENYFEFEVPDSSSLQLSFDERGRGITQNTSYDALPDTPGFHVFQLFDATEDNSRNDLVEPAVVEGNPGDNAFDVYQIALTAYQQLAAQIANFGNMVYPATHVDRKAFFDGYTLADATKFPLGANKELYLYIPIRRYSRGTQAPQQYSLIDAVLTPNNYILQAEWKERQEATLAWAQRNIHFFDYPNINIFQNAPRLLDLVDRTETLGNVELYFVQENGTLNTRDWEVNVHGMIITGFMAGELNTIRIGAGEANQLYFFVVQYDGSIEKANIGFGLVWEEDEIEFEPGVRYEMIWFKKSNIQVTADAVIYLDAGAWKTRLFYTSLLPNPDRDADLAALNGALGGNDLVLPAFVDRPGNSRRRAFNQCLTLFGNPIANADPDTNRPGMDPGGGGIQVPVTNLPYTVSDPYYNWVPTHGEYYNTVDPPGAPHYRLPNIHNPTADDTEQIEEENVEHEIRDELMAANRGTIVMLGDVSDFYQLPPVPIVRNDPPVIELNEPLLGFYGMSQFLPSSIYPVLSDFPPFLQSFMYNFTQQELHDCLIDDESWPTVLPRLIPTSTLEVTMESFQSFKQEDKELATVDLIWPKFEIFQSERAYNEIPTVHCETIRGKPDYVFVMLEHVYGKVPGENKGINPQINGLKFELLGENLPSISHLDSTALYHTTRRNSNIHADVAKNFDKTGGVLLSKEDCMDFVQYKGFDGVDLFPMDVTVTDSFYRDLAVTTLDMKLSVYFIYTGFYLRGKQYEAKFSSI